MKPVGVLKYGVANYVYGFVQRDVSKQQLNVKAAQEGRCI